jgi:hypothetical protein
MRPARPAGDEPSLASPPPESYAQAEQIGQGPERSSNLGTERPEQAGGGVVEKVKDAIR